jgi:hypothetical protein
VSILFRPTFLEGMDLVGLRPALGLSDLELDPLDFFKVPET